VVSPAATAFTSLTLSASFRLQKRLATDGRCCQADAGWPQFCMPISVEHERLRQAAVELLEPGDFEGTAYDDITRRASELCDAPVAIITVMDGNSQFFRSRVGTDLMSRPRELTFCTHALRDPERITIVEDASTDARFATNPVVTGAPYIRFYAGVPLMFHGQAIGTLCVFDVKPRTLQAKQLEELRFLATQVMETLQARHAPHAE
jgi:GAF domain-containing protein